MGAGRSGEQSLCRPAALMSPRGQLPELVVYISHSFGGAISAMRRHLSVNCHRHSTWITQIERLCPFSPELVDLIPCTQVSWGGVMGGGDRATSRMGWGLLEQLRGRAEEGTNVCVLPAWHRGGRGGVCQGPGVPPTTMEHVIPVRVHSRQQKLSSRHNIP